MRRMMILIVLSVLIFHRCHGYIVKSSSSSSLSSKRPSFSLLQQRGVLWSSSSDSTTSSSSSSSSGDAEEEWHPRDPAKTTAQLISGIWHQLVKAKKLNKGESMTVLYPNMMDEFSPSFLARLFAHLDACKDVCDDFGISTTLVPYKEKGQLVGFTAKSFKDRTSSDDSNANADDGGYNFAPDPFWSDDEDWSFMSEIEDDDDIQAAKQKAEEDLDLPDHITDIDIVPSDDDTIIQTSKRWVQQMMSNLALCPFTPTSDVAGLPVGQVRYEVDRSSQMEEMYWKYWEEVVRLEHFDQKDLSTTLLICPEFCMDNVEMFETFSNTLTQPLEPLKIEDYIQLVFFHPQWTFRDGGDRSGSANAANYARRSPWPMINILRTNQVRAAQKGIPTGLVYQQNEKTLNRIGSNTLERMLRLRDWSDVEGMKVDRKDIEALRVANDLQMGIATKDDTTMAFDSTPAANRVDRSQIDAGDIVNVILDALKKRLEGANDGGVMRLNGAETSAAMMASDFLLERLDQLIKTPQPKTTPKTTTTSQQRPPKYAALFDLDDQNDVNEDETSALFGGSGFTSSGNGDDDDGDGFSIRGGGIAGHSNSRNFF